MTNPPYLAKNKNTDKTLYDKYNLGDLYKISMKTLMGCEGGVIIIPLNFFSDKDKKFRSMFLSNYKIIDINIFEESVFSDTSYTVCAFSFIKEKNVSQTINPFFYPTLKQEKYILDKSTNYIIGDDFFKTLKNKTNLKIERLTTNGVPNSNLFLRAIDTGTEEGRIRLSINKEHFYGKSTDRSFATIILPQEYSDLSEEQEKKICLLFNEKLEFYRNKYKSLFLTNFRNSTSLYARKRIGFVMAYDLISHILHTEKIK